MDYKEKLRLAKEALELGSYDRETIEYIFPELKESDDEKIRKEIIEYLRFKYESPNAIRHDYEKWIAWLEKQGEQKVSVIDFKAKDWYVSKVDGKIYNAKFMEKPPTNQTRKLEIEKAAISATGIIEREEWFIKGAEWADENPFCVQIEKQGEPNPTRSEDDELHLEDAIHAAKEFYSPNCGGDELVDCLKSLKPQPQWKPSEEQIQALEYQVNSTYKGSWQYKASKELLEQLKKL